MTSGLPQDVYVRTFGAGPRKVLAFHCTIAHSATWRGLYDCLGEATTMIAPDMLSHGRSPDWDGAGDYQDRHAQIGEQLLTEPMDLIGHSFGATIALRLAVEHPDLVRSLTLIEPVYFAAARPDHPDLVARQLDSEGPFRDALSAGDPGLAARLFNRTWSGGATPWPDLPEATRAAMARGIPVVPACGPSLFDDRPGMLAPGVLDRVTCPSLLMRGSNCLPVIAAVNAGLEQRLPNVRSVEVAGAGHMLPLTHPVETAAHVTALFKSAV